ncbi:MAG TPA: heavy metal translocating P-type ATPase [Oligoflexia bacterium]|nr:heavy metal translocating P-type ATPase [Oligoflexia bacterium]HMP49115.1 heavy metal translocating P-type ATPase [Oligoflexia bacterium]
MELQNNKTLLSNPEDSSSRETHIEQLDELKIRWQLLLSLLILVSMLVLEFGFNFSPRYPNDLLIYLFAYLLAGYNVLSKAIKKIKELDFFNEFFLMSSATIGAFTIGSYSEGVAVMIFYSIGEWFQDMAINRAKRSIKALLDIRPDEVTLLENGSTRVVNARQVELNQIIQMKPGEKVALDGTLLSDVASFNTAALTGESVPDTKRKGEKVFAGMINLNTVSEVLVGSLFKDSKLSKILEMVQDSASRKSQTQIFINRFAKIYTPLVFALAIALCLLPYFFSSTYNFSDWFYRALVFLVISCPCALVVSIPLGYFGGIGLASRNGILFKGSNFLDVMTTVNTVVMDKTGTITKGVFKVQQVVANTVDKNQLIRLTASIEKNSTHPIAKAIVEYANQNITDQVEKTEESSGHGLKGIVEGKNILAGNLKLLKKFNIKYPVEIEKLVDTVVVVAINEIYAGYITIADEIKEDAKRTIDKLHALNIQTVMLSGDKQSVVDLVSEKVGINSAFGDLLPDGKVERVEALKKENRIIAFIGDGINDAPVIALADIGIAMGGLGSDATIETADVIIQNDQPSKVVSAIRIGKLTKSVVWQNIILAMSVKMLVLALGAGGVATLWEAVIADVGVTLVAILNAVRIQKISV